MSLSKYLQSLIPNAETADIKNGLTSNLDRIETTVIPSLERIGKVFDHKYKFVDPIIAGLAVGVESEMKNSQLKYPYDAGLMGHLDVVFKNMLLTIPFMRKEIDNTFGRNFTNVGLTFTKGNLIQYCETVDFVVNYVRVALNYLTSTELAKLEGKRVDPDLPKKDQGYLAANALVFRNAIGIMATTVEGLKSALKRIPDIVVDKDTESEIKITVGESNMDPLGFATLPFPVSLVFHFRLNRAEAEAEELERTKAEAKIVQYRMLLIQQRIDGGQGDAAIEEELKIQTDRLYKIRQRQTRMEEKYGV